MKIFKIVLSILFLFLFSFIIKPQSVDIQISYSKEEFNMNVIGPFSQIDSSSLPYISYFVILPHGAEINNVQVFIKETELFIDIAVSPFSLNKTIKEYCNSTDTQIIYNLNTDSSSNSIPKINDIIKLETPELQAGYLLVNILICPFQYDLEYKKLNLLKNIELKLNYSITNNQFDFETSEKKIEISKNYIRKLVLNPEELEKMLPLKEKIDYSKIIMFDEIEDDVHLRNSENVIIPDEKPYQIKKIK